MKLTLSRKLYRSDGIFGELLGPKREFLCVTLEHAYSMKEVFYPKVPKGTYQCTRGVHRLERMESSFVTFEVMDVPGRTGILFHVGNYNDESQGCILLGKQMGNKSNGGKMIMSSHHAFTDFLRLLEGLESFELTVE